MSTDTISRRRLLAYVPAMAAATAPTAATALPGLASAIPDHLDTRQVKGLAEALSMLEKMPKGEANKVLTAIKESIELGMRNYAHDAELLALKPQFDEVFEEWWAREEGRRSHPDDYSPRSDEEIGEATDTLYELIDKILSYESITREGLKLQCCALIMDGYETWDDRTARFMGNFVVYFNIDLPRMLAVQLLTRGQNWDDEDEEEEDEEEARS